MFFFFFFRAPLSFLRSPMAENSTTSNRVCLLSPSPGVPVLQKAQEITRGNIKAHKQDTHTHTHTARRKERKCVHLQMCACVCVCACFKTHTGLCKWLWACVCARLHKELEFRAFTRCSCVCLWVAGSATFFLVVSDTHACSTHTHTLPVLHPT